MAAINEMLLEHSSQAAKELVDKFNYDLEPFSDFNHRNFAKYLTL